MTDYQNKEIGELREFLDLLDVLNTADHNILTVRQRLEDDIREYSWFRGDELLTVILSYIMKHVTNMAFIGGVDITDAKRIYEEEIE